MTVTDYGTEKPVRPFTGRHLLYALLGFFGVMLIANVIFVWLALDTFTGVASKTAYQDGLAYNERLEAAAEQQARGWSGQVTLVPGALDLLLVDREGQPVRGLQLEAFVRRPTEDDSDRWITMVEREAGHYRAPLELPLKGNWDVVISGENQAGVAFETRTRLWVE
ncbi:MAG: FixH family protein [Rhodospirillales bacterium]